MHMSHGAMFRGGMNRQGLCLGLLGLAALACAPAPALAVSAKKVPQKVEYVDPRQRLAGGETPAQRERRLRRECKGRPDAGACRGHTR